MKYACMLQQPRIGHVIKKTKQILQKLKIKLALDRYPRLQSNFFIQYRYSSLEAISSSNNLLKTS